MDWGFFFCCIRLVKLGAGALDIAKLLNAATQFDHIDPFVLLPRLLLCCAAELS